MGFMMLFLCWYRMFPAQENLTLVSNVDFSLLLEALATVRVAASAVD
jgi:hypothetical protein